ncbi:hypothetical protein SAMN05444413_1302 [Roseivivax marinus]|nr:hypothetical protein SAMN05444413_1302 [Roseivivax marinus]
MRSYDIHVGRAYRGLIELGYLKQTRDGYYDRSGGKNGKASSRITRYSATDKLVGLFTEDEQLAFPAVIPAKHVGELVRVQVKMKNPDGTKVKTTVPTPVTGDVELMRWRLERINRGLSHHWYDLDMPDADIAALQDRLSDDVVNSRQLALHHRSLYRVFNDEDLTTGGRFYGGWWQGIPKEYRPYLCVNGKRMVEVDYSTMHPTILYAWVGEEMPEDSYSGVLPSGLLPDGVDPSEVRGSVKAAFNAMLNAERVLKGPPAGINLRGLELTWNQLSNAIIEFHKPISEHFYSGVGLKLQRIDSDIAEAVILDFIDSGDVILPIHDSFLVHHGWEGRLREKMAEAFGSLVGSLAQVKGTPGKQWEEKEPKWHQGNDEFGPIISTDIRDHSEWMNSGPERRLEAHRAIRQTKQS